MSKLPARLQEIVEDFSYCEGQEKLEYLLELAESLPPLPDWLTGKRDEMDEVHECMTPVFIYPEKQDGKLFFHFDIPPESPTVRGFASVLQQGLGWTTPEQVSAIPNEFYLQMGLQTVLTGQRLNGISAMLAHMKTLARS
ncbi:MAG: SufE family protein [Anaerolineales bacterium]|nr:SufE family protein [Anaerolineales bacterium]MCA9929446.1 SufE family protein [Anaerolineales bacterium]